MRIILKLSVFSIVLGMLIACEKSEDNGPEIEDNDTITDNSLLVDDGSIGLVIDTRDIAKKGYSPDIASILFPGSYSDYSKDVPVDENTNVATLSFGAEDFEDYQVKELAEGITMTIIIKDNASQELARLNDILKVDASNTPVVMDTDLPKLYPELTINEETPYLLQVINDDPDVSNKLFFLRVDNNYEPGFDPIVLREFNSANKYPFSFYFESINDTLYHIKMKLSNDATPFYLRMSGPGNFYSYYVTDPTLVDSDIYKFVVKYDENGLLKFRPLSGNPLGKLITTYDTQVSYAGSPEDYFPVRMVAANITWEVQDRGTEYNPPIIPPAKLDFAFESLLKNCSSATLTETVGKSESRTKSYTVGTEESLELYTSHEASVDVTAGVETEANLFGQKATASLEVSLGYTFTTSSTNTTTNTWSETVEETVEVSRVRDVEIPPFTAVEVFDAIQVIENVKMPFVQKLRVKGLYDDTTPLSGQEINSQLLANQFGGVVSKVEADYVEISIRGTATIDKFFEVESQVNELEGVCSE